MPLSLTRTLAVLISLVGISLVVAADEKAPPATALPRIDIKLVPIARFAGEWTVAGKWLDDNDHFTWKVEMKADQEWQTLIDATWVRKAR